MLIYLLGAMGERRKQLAMNVQRHFELRRGLKPQQLCILKGTVVAERWHLFRAYQSNWWIARTCALARLITSLKTIKDICGRNIARVLPYLGRVHSTNRCPEAKMIE